MTKPNNEQEAADITNPYSESMSEADLELALAKAAARHPSVPTGPTHQPHSPSEFQDATPTDATLNNIVHLPLHKLIDKSEPKP